MLVFFRIGKNFPVPDESFRTTLLETGNQFRGDNADLGIFIGAVFRYESLERELAEELNSTSVSFAIEFLPGQIDDLY